MEQHRSALGLDAGAGEHPAHRGGPGPLPAQQPAVAVPAAAALDRTARRPRPAAAGRRPGRAGSFAWPAAPRCSTCGWPCTAWASAQPSRSFPTPRSRPCIAAVRDGGRKPPTPHQLRLLQAVPTRRTNRRPFDDVAVSRDRAARVAAGRTGGGFLAAGDRGPDAAPDAAAAGRRGAPRAARRPRLRRRARPVDEHQPRSPGRRTRVRRRAPARAAGPVDDARLHRGLRRHAGHREELRARAGRSRC